MQFASLAYTDADLGAFLIECRASEQGALATRLEAASQRLGELVDRMPEASTSDTDHWSAHEVLAHMAGLSKYYGVVAYRIGQGAVTEIDMLADVRQRDTILQQLAVRTGEELAAAAQADHRRTIEWLLSADPGALQRRASIGAGRSLSADEVLRLGLLCHLEMHLNQLESALQGSRRVS